MKSVQSKPKSKSTRQVPKPLSELKTDEKRLLKKLQDAVSPDLLKGDYKWSWPDDERYQQHLEGHCYAVTEAFYHLIGKAAGYKPYCLKHTDGSHWWLYNPDTDQILDPTLQQLGRERFRYDQGHPQNFQTSTPSERAKRLMDRISETDKEEGE